jgi:2-amino-4-hydroxy-6-hydroxymethyldihydropteridine diphosphokinase
MVKRPGFTTCKTFWALSKPAYIALGSNLGDPVATLQSAFDELKTLSRRPIQQSSLWRSTPVDCPPDSPDFINATAALTPLDGETPESLLEKLQALEVQFGRQPKVVMNEPRPLDLDLIAFRDEQRQGAQLTLPHPRFQERRFVLEPLAEIAPETILPGQSVTVAELLARLEADETLTRL